MNIVIDKGNTLTKIAVFEGNNLIFHDKQSLVSLDYFEYLFKNFSSITFSIVSSVSDFDNQLLIFLKQKTELVAFNHTTKIPITNNYKTPETLGLDRLASVIGANSLVPNANCLVIDAGTAITFDFINSSAEYCGGTISPGMTMRFKALNNFTKKLPLCEPDEDVNFLGDTTISAIKAGVQNGLIAEINSYIQKLDNENNKLNVFLTGGDTFFFDKKLKKPIFADPFLVLKGLNRILSYNVEK